MLTRSFLLIAFLISFSNVTLARDFLAVAQDFPPLHFKIGEEVVGGMTEVMKEICKRAKHNCKFEIVALARAVKLMEEGGADAFVSSVALPERASFSHFTEPIVLLSLAYMGLERNKTQKMKDLQELSGWTVVATRGGAPAKLALKHSTQVKEMTVTDEVDNATMIKNLNAGKYGSKALILGTEEVLTDVAAAQGVALETIYPVEDIQMVITFSKKKVSADEAKKLDRVIKRMKKDGTIKKILGKYKLRAA